MFWAGCFNEAGPIPLFGGCVKGKLTHNKGLAVSILDGEIHFAIGVIENAHFGDFSDEPVDVFGAIRFLDA